MSNPEHLALVKKGSLSVNEAVARGAGPLDLSQADLSGADLNECDFHDANLTGANLEGADLRKARFGGANLQNAVLKEADLRKAMLHRADLRGADVRGIKLEPIGMVHQLICLSPNIFAGARWDKERIEEALAILNLNRDWEIRYEIVPKSR